MRRSGPAVLVTAFLFSIAHIPNPVLVPVTFFAGLAFTGRFRKYRDLYPLALAHAFLGLALAAAVPDAVTHHMRVGLAYWINP